MSSDVVHPNWKKRILFAWSSWRTGMVWLSRVRLPETEEVSREKDTWAK